MKTLSEYAQELLTCPDDAKGDYCCSSSHDGLKVTASHWGFCSDCYFDSLCVMQKELGTTTDALSDFFGDEWDNFSIIEKDMLVSDFLDYQKEQLQI
jgi:hypothetical protein